MSALVPIVPRRRLRAAIMVRAGLGWRVGTGNAVTGELEPDACGYPDERQAEAATIALADRLDLIALRE